jgi:hypothetical protein
VGDSRILSSLDYNKTRDRFVLRYNKRGGDVMKAKDLLTAIQVDAEGELKQLSSYTYVFIADGKKLTNRIEVKVEEGKILLTKQPKELLTVAGLIKVLNEAKEAEIYAGDLLVFGYKLADNGIILG